MIVSVGNNSVDDLTNYLNQLYSLLLFVRKLTSHHWPKPDVNAFGVIVTLGTDRFTESTDGVVQADIYCYSRSCLFKRSFTALWLLAVFSMLCVEVGFEYNPGFVYFVCDSVAVSQMPYLLYSCSPVIPVPQVYLFKYEESIFVVCFMLAT